MDASTITQVWVDLATNAPFLGFLLYQWHIQRKDVRDYKTEIRQLRTEAKEEEKQLRSRFEVVIADLNQDRDAIVSGLQRRIRTIESKIESIEKSIKKIFAVLLPMQERLKQQEIKEAIKKEITSGSLKGIVVTDCFTSSRAQDNRSVGNTYKSYGGNTYRVLSIEYTYQS